MGPGLIDVRLAGCRGETVGFGRMLTDHRSKARHERLRQIVPEALDNFQT